MGLKKVLGAGAALVAKRHLKFDDEGEDSFHTADEGNSTLDAVDSGAVPAKDNNDRSDSESESEDESDAPEEEGLSSGKDQVEQKIKEREEALRMQEKAAQEKRRKAERILRQQQADKKRREQKAEEERKQKMLQFESKLKEQMASNGNEDPEELPEEFFDELDSNLEANGRTPELQTQKPEHITFDAEEAVRINEEKRKQKRKTLRGLRRTEVNKGPVTVKLLSSMHISRTLAPKSERKVMKSKEKWLKRRSLKRK